jgi:hypothetical protein
MMRDCQGHQDGGIEKQPHDTIPLLGSTIT